MCEGVDAEGGVPFVYRLDEYHQVILRRSLPDQQSGNKASPNVSTHGIVPAEFCYQGRQDESRKERDADVVLVLEDNDCGTTEISIILKYGDGTYQDRSPSPLAQ